MTKSETRKRLEVRIPNHTLRKRRLGLRASDFLRHSRFVLRIWTWPGILALKSEGRITKEKVRSSSFGFPSSFEIRPSDLDLAWDIGALLCAFRHPLLGEGDHSHAFIRQAQVARFGSPARSTERGRAHPP